MVVDRDPLPERLTDLVRPFFFHFFTFLRVWCKCLDLPRRDGAVKLVFCDLRRSRGDIVGSGDGGGAGVGSGKGSGVGGGVGVGSGAGAAGTGGGGTGSGAGGGGSGAGGVGAGIPGIVAGTLIGS